MNGTFKTVVLTAFSAFSIFSIATFTSCKEDKCKAITCAYGGVCNEGNCNCKPGYEGTLCETETRKKFTGIWHVLEDGTASNANHYGASIEPGVEINEVLIKNLRNSFVENIVANVKGDTLYIPFQTRDNKNVEGIGYLEPEKYDGSHAKFVLRYKVVDNVNSIVDDFGLDKGKASLWNK